MLKIAKLFSEYKIIFYYDLSEDKTLEKLNNYKSSNPNVKIIINEDTIFCDRTKNIAKGRNTILDCIRNNYSDYEYFIMMDCDNVCSGHMNSDVLQSYLEDNRWDSLSFNHRFYYDLWALSIEPYVYSCWLLSDNKREEMHKYISNTLDKMNDENLLDVISAFNGFSIYRTSLFLDCSYDGSLRLDLIPKYILDQSIEHCGNPIIDSKNVDCEHRSFHLQAKYKNGARIMISKKKLFYIP
jgi:hypothetical protein